MSISTQITVVTTAEQIIVTAPGALRGPAGPIGPVGDVTPELSQLVVEAEAARDASEQGATASIEAKDAAEQAASSAEAVIIPATNQANIATNAAERSESAASLAASFSNPFPSVVEGLANTSGSGASNRFFSVPGTGSALSVAYRNDAGAATEIGSSPSGAVVSELSAVVDTKTDLSDLSEYEFVLIGDGKDQIAMSVSRDGTVNVGLTKDVGGKAALVPDIKTESERTKLILLEDESFSQSGYWLPFVDDAGRVACGITRAGDFEIAGKSVNSRLYSLEQSGVVNPEIDKWVNGLSIISSFGDSLSVAYPAIMSGIIGRTVLTRAVGGQNSQQIATRQGGYVNLITVDGNTIPASGTVNVIGQTQNPISDQGGNNIHGTIYGIPGVLSATYAGTTRTSLTFTRDVPGSETKIDPATPFVIDAGDTDFTVSVLWYGRNNFYTGRTDFENAKAEVKAALAASIEFIKPLSKKFVVMSVLNDNKEAEWVGTEKYEAITSLNEEIKSLYPRNFIDIRRMLVRQYNPAIPQDVIDFDHDVTPSSLRSDTLHLNFSGNTFVANTVSNFILQKGW